MLNSAQRLVFQRPPGRSDTTCAFRVPFLATGRHPRAAPADIEKRMHRHPNCATLPGIDPRVGNSAAVGAVSVRSKHMRAPPSAFPPVVNPRSKMRWQPRHHPAAPTSPCKSDSPNSRRSCRIAREVLFVPGFRPAFRRCATCLRWLKREKFRQVRIIRPKKGHQAGSSHPKLCFAGRAVQQPARHRQGMYHITQANLGLR